MKIEIRSSFVKASKKLPANIQQRISEIIEQIEEAKNIRGIDSCKKLTGYKTAYRIKLETYRIGFFFEKGVVELTTVLHRRYLSLFPIID